ncbi:MAG TPA: DUF2182 domain-containing protein [Stellaceae bacterium]|nr:DUF2182 domain-containing protein [Stellaceae bacterium]
MTIAGALETRRDHAVLWSAVVAIVALAWTYLLQGAGMERTAMEIGGGMMMSMPSLWTPGHVAGVFQMWVVMMVAMMLPAAIPAALASAGSGGEQRNSARRGGRAALFVIGYLAVWTGFSVAATLLQWTLDCANQLSETMTLRSPVAIAALIIVVGLSQLSPLKRACLGRCRAMAECPAGGRSEGAWATVRQGTRHGLSCLGCCAALMSLMFVAGVMNVAVMALISLWVLAERVPAWGSRVTVGTAVGLVVTGGLALLMTLV